MLSELGTQPLCGPAPATLTAQCTCKPRGTGLWLSALSKQVPVGTPGPHWPFCLEGSPEPATSCFALFETRVVTPLPVPSSSSVLQTILQELLSRQSALSLYRLLTLLAEPAVPSARTPLE